MKKIIFFSLALLFLVCSFVISEKGTASLRDIFLAYLAQAQEKPFEKPEIIRGIYFTSYSASSNSKINYAINLARQGKINAVVIDVKDYSGHVFFNTNAEKAKEYGAVIVRIKDIPGLVKKLHNEGIYTIARIAVFQDPVLAGARNDIAVYKKYQESSFLGYLFSAVSLWLDNHRLSWVDPASEEAWQYNIDIAKDAIAQGFDEVNFDYVRFPSDGNLSNMGFPKWDGKTPRHAVLKNFFKKVREEIPDAVLSVDLFGLTTVNSDDLGVGQVIEDAYEYFDYVCPMVYPSHYASGFIGYSNPAAYPYEVVAYSMENANYKLTEFKNASEKTPFLRPWLQDFDMGADYNKGMVDLEITATEEALKGGYKGYLLWNPSNIYSQ